MYDFIYLVLVKVTSGNITFSYSNLFLFVQRTCTRSKKKFRLGSVETKEMSENTCKEMSPCLM